MPKFATTIGAVGQPQLSRPLDLPSPPWYEVGAYRELPAPVADAVDNLVKDLNLNPGAQGSFLDGILAAVDKLTKQSGQNIKNILGKDGAGGALTDNINSLFSMNTLLIPALGIAGILVLYILIKL